MATQNRFKTGLDIAKYTAANARKDMADYDANVLTHAITVLGMVCCATKYNCSKSITKQQVKDTFTCLDGWLLLCVLNLDLYLINPCTKTTVPALIKEIYDFFCVKLMQLARKRYKDTEQLSVTV
jgi:isocitrate lyase